MSRLPPAIGHAFYGGKIFGAERARWRQWGYVERVVRASLFPVIAMMKMMRSADVLADDPSIFRVIGNVVAACPIVLAHALGEALGTCFGKGHSGENYAVYEVNRSCFLRKADRRFLAA